MSAAEKTLVVLEAAVGASRFSAIVEATELPKATVHRLLGELIERGFLVATAAGPYLPGPTFLNLAGRALERVDISALATAHIDELAEATGCAVHLGVLSGDEVIYIARRDSDKPYRMPSRVGSAMPLHTTAIGKALLTDYDDIALRAYAERCRLTPRTPVTITTLDALARELRTSRERGFTTEREENVPGVTCLAAPIRDHTGAVNYAISLSTLAIEHSPEALDELAPHVKRAAEKISVELGSRP
ncbi:IclR family transcriptional regulator [Demequina flava]|uniref:IclR family transcriptional regulator n=1 Tax=Demequina flava TaxID=1095025 RepID=UPI000B072ADB|nr:IclR family transcriptional regulator [Demequina flava]